MPNSCETKMSLSSAKANSDGFNKASFSIEDILTRKSSPDVFYDNMRQESIKSDRRQPTNNSSIYDRAFSATASSFGTRSSAVPGQSPFMASSASASQRQLQATGFYASTVATEQQTPTSFDRFVSGPSPASVRTANLFPGNDSLSGYYFGGRSRPEVRCTYSSVGAGSAALSKLHSGSRSRRRRTRAVFSNEQLSVLEERFETQKYISTLETVELASQLSITEIQVKTWFQNRRSKQKKLDRKSADHTKETRSPCHVVPSNTSSHGLVASEQADSEPVCTNDSIRSLNHPTTSSHDNCKSDGEKWSRQPDTHSRPAPIRGQNDSRLNQ